LKGTPTAPDMSQNSNVTQFDLDTTSSDYSTFHVWVKLLKDDNGKYAVLLQMGERSGD